MRSPTDETDGGPGALGTCLFTNVPLHQDPTNEHWVPAALGGRSPSRSVTCATFNNACSAADCELAGPYQYLLHALSPLLPAGRPKGLLRLSDDSGRALRMEAGRTVGLRGRAQVLALDRVSRRPSLVLADDDLDPSDVMARLGMPPEATRVTYAPLVNGAHLWGGR